MDLTEIKFNNNIEIFKENDKLYIRPIIKYYKDFSLDKQFKITELNIKLGFKTVDDVIKDCENTNRFELCRMCTEKYRHE